MTGDETTNEDVSTRERIMQVAMRLFAERGYSETPIKEIARHCNLSDAGVFHHFRTKKEILAAILSRPHKRMESHVDDEPVVDDRTLQQLVFRTLDSASDNEPILRVLIRQQLLHDPEAMAARDMALSNWRISLLDWFNCYEPSDAEILVDVFINAMMGWIFIHQIRHGAALQEMFVADHFRTRTMNHIRAALPLERFRVAARHARAMAGDAG